MSNSTNTFEFENTTPVVLKPSEEGQKSPYDLDATRTDTGNGHGENFQVIMHDQD